MGFPNEFPWLLLYIFLVSLILTGLGLAIARKSRLMPEVRDRDVHTTKKPRVGGIAMWICVFLSFAVILNSKWSHLLDFHDKKIAGIDSALWGVIAGMVIILIFGIIDDVKSLSPKQQFLGQILACLALVIFGIGVPYFRLPNGDLVNLQIWGGHFPSWLGGSQFYFWSAAFVMLWTGLVMNVMNFFDGLDGLAGSVSATAALVLIGVSLRVGFLATATLAVILLATTLGFLPWNWHPSKLFMGTVGSQLLGFLLAVIAIISGAKVATALLVLGIPILDALIVIARRLKAHVSPFKADQRHLHHRLLRIGLSTPWVVVVINIFTLIFGLSAYFTQAATSKGYLTIGLVLAMALLMWVTYYLDKTRGSNVILTKE